MIPKEQEIALSELEDRVERLRNLYEQYFLGFEKLEPLVPRKDVDRRFAILRKEHLRNTALRFRFQGVTQRYNTYAMHWVRICRQIEEGSYKRHLQKAKARFGGDSARGTASAAAQNELALDVDVGDFESLDLDMMLSNLESSREPPEPDAVSTMRRGASHAPLSSSSRAVRAEQGDVFAVPPSVARMSLGEADLRFGEPPESSRSVHGEPSVSPPSVRDFPASERVPRSVARPLGSKPLLVRKRDESAPASLSPGSMAMPPRSSSPASLSPGSMAMPPRSSSPASLSPGSMAMPPRSSSPASLSPASMGARVAAPPTPHVAPKLRLLAPESRPLSPDTPKMGDSPPRGAVASARPAEAPVSVAARSGPPTSVRGAQVVVSEKPPGVPPAPVPRPVAASPASKSPLAHRPPMPTLPSASPPVGEKPSAVVAAPATLGSRPRPPVPDSAPQASAPPASAPKGVPRPSKKP